MSGSKRSPKSVRHRQESVKRDTTRAENPKEVLDDTHHPEGIQDEKYGKTKNSGRMFNALSNRVRRQILAAITGQEKTVSQLTKELGYHHTTLRYHLDFLMSQEMVEEIEPSDKKSVGRPASSYRARRAQLIHGFPERRYEVILDLALQTLVDSIGMDKATEQLADKGRASGRSIIEQVIAQSGIKDWGPESFERLVLKGAFQDFGVINQVISRSKHDLVFRVFNCPFLEVAVNSPEIICDSLDLGFHEGIDEAVGGAMTERHACLGHGDMFCEYRISWPERQNRKSARTQKVRKSSPPGRARLPSN